jgi:hypothetical protein
MRHRSADKENSDYNSIITKVTKGSKSLFKKKPGESFFTVDTNVECRSSDDKNH